MEFNTRRIKIRDVVDGYVNNDEEGVVGYGGNLNIRPKYQREFVYSMGIYLSPTARRRR